MIGVWGLCVVLWTVPLNGKSASFRSCVRAKLCVCVREIMLLYAGLAILKFFSGVPFRFVPSAYGVLCFAWVLRKFPNIR